MSDTDTPMITKRMLKGACKEQREIFRREWPGGAPATLENVLRAVELGLDLAWGERWFTPEALAEYEWQVVTLGDEYGRQRATLGAECKRQRATLWAEYERQVATLWAEYERQVATLWLAAFLASQGGTP